MEFGALFFAAAVVTTADFCATPYDGGVREPQFCRLTYTQEISTPFFSVTVGPELLVGVDRKGHRMVLEATIRQSPAGLTIEVLEGADLPSWPDCPVLTELTIDGRIWQDCQISGGALTERRIATVIGDMHIVAQYRFGSIAKDLAEPLERVLHSLRVHAI